MKKLLAIMAVAALACGLGTAFASDVQAPVKGAVPLTTAEMDDARGSASFGNRVDIPTGTTINGGAFLLVYDGNQWVRTKK